MALKLDDRPDQDADKGGVYDDGKPSWRNHATPDDDLENMYDAPAINDEDRNAGRSGSNLEDLERRYNQPAIGDRHRNAGTSAKAGDDTKSPSALNGMEKSHDAPSLARGGAAGGAGGLASMGGGVSDKIGKGFRQEGLGAAASVASKLKASFLGEDRRQTLIGGGVFGAVAGIIVFLMIATSTLKNIHTMENVQDKYGGVSRTIMHKWESRLMRKWIVENVAGGLGPACTSTKISSSCVRIADGATKWGQFSNELRQVRQEKILGDAINFEGTYDTRTGEKIFKIGDTTISSADFARTKDFRSAVNQSLDAAMDEANLVERSRVRYTSRRLWEGKYSHRACIVACDLRDDFRDGREWVGRKKQAAELKIIERVISPHSEGVGVIFECIVSGGCESWASDGPNGEARTEAEARMAQRLEALAVRYGDREAVEALVKIASEISEKKLSGYLIEKIVTKMFGTAVGEATGKAASKLIPIIGWLDLAFTIINFVNDSLDHLKRWIYTAQAAMFVKFFLMYRTYADEQKSGHVDSDMVGSFTSKLGEKQHKDDNGNMTGPSAEGSPMWGQLLGKGPGYIKDATYEYRCNDGNALPIGQLVCPEETLNAKAIIQLALSLYTFATKGGCSDKTKQDISNAQGLDKLNPSLSQASPFGATGDLSCTILLARAWKLTFGKVLEVIGGVIANGIVLVIEHTPFISDFYNWAKGEVEQVAGKIIEFATNWLVPQIIDNNMTGGRAFTALAAGADVFNNDYAHYMLGGRELSDQEVADLRYEHEDMARERLAKQPLYARLFDTKNSRSLVSRIAVMMPADYATAVSSSFSHLLANPFGRLIHTIGVAIPNPTAHAAIALPDPYNIKQYGLTDADMPEDPGTLTEEYCKQFDESWLKDTTIDDNTGMEVHKRANPCRMNDMTMCMIGARFKGSNAVGCPQDTPAQSSNSNKLFVLGDSYAVGAQSGLTSKLTEPDKGWLPTVDGQVGRPLAGAGLAQVDQPAVQEAIKGAGAVVIMLGTNDLPSGNSISFKNNVVQMAQKIHTISPDVKIYWVNLYLTTNANTFLNAFNEALDQASGSEKFTVIDWAGQAASNYDANQIHPRSYQPLVDAIANAVGKSPTGQ